MASHKRAALEAEQIDGEVDDDNGASEPQALREARVLELDDAGSRTVVVDGHEIPVRRLSANQWIAAFRVASSALGQMTPAEQQAAEQGNVSEGFAFIMRLLDEPKILKFIAVLMKKDEGWVEAHFDLAGILDYLEALSEVEDLRRVMAGFRSLARKFRANSAPA